MVTVAAEVSERGAATRATELVDLGLRACEAYGRPDLAERLTRARRSLADPSVHVVVVGEFKQGKSSLINALVGATVCPVDDDVATAVPTYVRHGAEMSANLILDGDPPRRQPITEKEVRGHVLENGEPPDLGEHRITGVEIAIPRKILASGLVMVDTPGVGGLASAHAAASLAAIAMADAVLFLTDASQELTRSELDFLRQARQICPAVACVLTKTDFYPAWRRIRQINEGHLRAVPAVPLMAVSSALRSKAVAGNDTALNGESGFAEVVTFVRDRVAERAVDKLAAEAAAEVAAVCEQFDAQFSAERAAVVDPAGAQRVIDELTTVKERVEALKTAAARWNQTLNDGIADLTSDIDHDLRSRIRRVLQEADESLEEVDPANTWSETESWLESRLAHELLANYMYLRQRADALSEEVGRHFVEASGEVLNRIAVHNPTPLLSRAKVDHRIDLETMKVRKQAMVVLKSGYGGALMFTMLGSLAGIVLGPLSIGIGLVMGHRGLKEEKKKQVVQRRAQARNAVRRYCDEVTFVMAKDSRDTLRRIQRQLRDHYGGLAEELNRSNAQALASAQEAVKKTQAEREKRRRDLDAELTRVRQLKTRAAQLTAGGAK